ncbi:urease accessory protein, UreD [Aureimonas ureilytica]|uniref:Urease accessory protein UreD n=1 Tax=Aureimonas ureilytica TaxID=401562 RepID=A0A175RMM5_9HYPH|nr:urease accessory protein UreD [Aureimonas ureilytica]KTR04072.1 urease accessory protein, UreD [Aureimonas ureilytica]
MLIDLPREAGDVPLVRAQRAHGEARATFGPTGPRGETRLRHLHQAGALKLRFPRVAQAEAVLINTAGGLTGGDALRQSFEVEPGGALRVTTQACERIYRSTGADARVSTCLTVAPNAALSYLPQETILFDGGRLSRSLDVDAASSSRLLLCESVVLGREAMGESVTTGALRDRWRVRRDGQLILADDLKLGGDMAELTGRNASLGAARAFATVFWQDERGEGVLPALREVLGPEGGASHIDGFGMARLVAPSYYALRKRLVPALALLSQVGLPRVWSL